MKRNLNDLPMPENYHDGAASTPSSNSQWILEGLPKIHGSLALGFTSSELDDVSSRWPKIRASAAFDCQIRSNLVAIARDRIGRKLPFVPGGAKVSNHQEAPVMCE